LFFYPSPSLSCLYPLSLHDALPIFSLTIDRRLESAHLVLALGHLKATSEPVPNVSAYLWSSSDTGQPPDHPTPDPSIGPELVFRSEEHTSELQSRSDIVCRLLLEKK